MICDENFYIGNMKARIIKITDGKVYLSNEKDEGKFFTVEKSLLEFDPVVGNFVDVFTSENGETLVIPAKNPPIVLAESVANPVDGLDDISEKSRAAAAILCFFFGWLGVHNFYLGNIWQGLLPLALWGGLFLFPIFVFVNPFFVLLGTLCPFVVGLLTLVDFILILCGIKNDGNDCPVCRWG